MPQFRLALAQVNPTVGDLNGNVEIIIANTVSAHAAGAQLVAFPEMVLTGYPIEDLAFRKSFQHASLNALDSLAARLAGQGLGDIAVIVGYLGIHETPDPRLGVPIGAPTNSAAVLHGGHARAHYSKHHLPNYGVFDESRYFVPGEDPCVIRIGGIDVAVAICEDLWQEGGPVTKGLSELLVIINGSPYEMGKADARFGLVSRRARELNSAIAYVNMVGGQDELVFDGSSIVVDQNGTLLARAPQFHEHLLVIDLDLPVGTGSDCVEIQGGSILGSASAPPVPIIATPQSQESEIYRALTLGLKDYVRKNGFKSVTFGFSGGIDSALVAVLAADAIGADNVYGISMPSKYSSQHSQDDAMDLARRLGANFRTIPIGPMFDAFTQMLDLTGLAEENLQARIRGVVVMAISNQEGHLVLAPGNKSELSVGYSTIYGDAVGGFGPIKDLPKTWVYRLANWRNEEALRRGEIPPIPPSSIAKEPSAELRPGQVDIDSLPAYDVLDALLASYIDRDLDAESLVQAGYEIQLVSRILRLTDHAEYKRRQYPIGTKVTSRAFGRDRRLPITNNWRESAKATPYQDPQQAPSHGTIVPSGDSSREPRDGSLR